MMRTEVLAQLDQMDAYFQEFLELEKCTREQLVALLSAMGNYQAAKTLQMSEDMNVAARRHLAASFAQAAQAAIQVAFGKESPDA